MCPLSCRIFVLGGGEVAATKDSTLSGMTPRAPWSLPKQGTRPKQDEAGRIDGSKRKRWKPVVSASAKRAQKREANHARGYTDLRKKRGGRTMRSRRSRRKVKSRAEYEPCTTRTETQRIHDHKDGKWLIIRTSQAKEVDDYMERRRLEPLQNIVLEPFIMPNGVSGHT